MATAVWQGTVEEFDRLQGAVAGNCECVPAMLGIAEQTCPPHAMLLEQSVLDHLLYVFRMRGVFVRREFYALSVPSR